MKINFLTVCNQMNNQMNNQMLQIFNASLLPYSEISLNDL